MERVSWRLRTEETKEESPRIGKSKFRSLVQQATLPRKRGSPGPGHPEKRFKLPSFGSRFRQWESAQYIWDYI